MWLDDLRKNLTALQVVDGTFLLGLCIEENRFAYVEIIYDSMWGCRNIYYGDLTKLWNEWIKSLATQTEIDVETATLFLMDNGALSGAVSLDSTAIAQSFTENVLANLSVRENPIIFFAGSNALPQNLEIAVRNFVQQPAALQLNMPTLPDKNIIVTQAKQQFPQLPWQLGILVAQDLNLDIIIQMKELQQHDLKIDATTNELNISVPPLYSGICEDDFFLVLAKHPNTNDEKILFDSLVNAEDTAAGVTFRFEYPSLTPIIQIPYQDKARSQNIRQKRILRQLTQTSQVAFLIDGNMALASFMQVQQAIKHACERLDSHNPTNTLQVGGVVFGEYMDPPPMVSELVKQHWTPEFSTHSIGFTSATSFLETLEKQELVNTVTDYCTALELGLADLHTSFVWNMTYQHVILIGFSPPHPNVDDADIECLPANLFTNGKDWSVEYNKLKHVCGGNLAFHSIFLNPQKHPSITTAHVSDMDIAYCKHVYEKLATNNKVLDLQDLPQVIDTIIRQQVIVRFVQEPIKIPFLHPPKIGEYRVEWC